MASSVIGVVSALDQSSISGVASVQSRSVTGVISTGGVASLGLYIASYGDGSYSEVVAAHTAGRVVVCVHPGRDGFYARLSALTSQLVEFTLEDEDGFIKYSLTSSDEWSESRVSFQRQGATGVLITSATDGSDKQYAIVVDDDGVVGVVEGGVT